MNKVFKKIIYVVTLLLMLLLVLIPIFISQFRNRSTINTFTEFREPNELSFCDIRWTNDLLGEEEIGKTAFFVPVEVRGLSGNLFMQFDSGTQTSFFYGKTLNQLIKPNSSIKTFYNEDSLRYIEDPVLRIADMEFGTDQLRIASSLGSETIDTSFINIGSIGFDAFVNRTLILDFKNDKLSITNKTASELNYSLETIKGASVNKFPLMIPAKIGNKKTKLFFDTGASMFSLITSNKRLQKINNSKVDSLCCISNWDRQIPVYRKELHTPIEIGNSSYENQSIYGCEVLDMVNYVPSWYLFGMTGNRLFDKKVVIIDTKNNKFYIGS